MNKRGQGLSTNAIIMIILGVAILVILILGFTLGWKSLVPFIKQDNVDTIVKACETACSTKSKFSYCSKIVELKTEDKRIDTTCYLLEKVDEFNKYGLEACNIDCEIECKDLEIDGNKGSTELSEGYDITSFASKMEAGKTCFIAKK